jgi:hypothetical protein
LGEVCDLQLHLLAGRTNRTRISKRIGPRSQRTRVRIGQDIEAWFTRHGEASVGRHPCLSHAGTPASCRRLVGAARVVLASPSDCPPTRWHPAAPTGPHRPGAAFRLRRPPVRSVRRLLRPSTVSGCASSSANAEQVDLSGGSGSHARNRRRQGQRNKKVAARRLR